MTDRLAAIFSSLNRRTAYGLIVLAFLLGFVQALNIGDRVALKKAERDVIEQRLGQYGEGLDTELWTARASAANAISGEWQSLFWPGSTTGIIASQIQSRLNTISAQTLLENVRVEVDPNIVDLPTGEALRFSVNARSSDAIDLIKALNMVSGNEPILIIRELNLNVRPDDSGIMIISGIAPIDVQSATAATPQGAL